MYDDSRASMFARASSPGCLLLAYFQKGAVWKHRYATELTRDGRAGTKAKAA